MLAWRLRGRRFESNWCHFVVSLSKNIHPSLVLVQSGKTNPFITERLLMGRKELNQSKTKPIFPFLSPLYLLEIAIMVCEKIFKKNPNLHLYHANFL